MPVTISQHVGVSAKVFAETGAFDSVLDFDSKLFIHPQLLKATKTQELNGAYPRLTNAFRDVMHVLKASKNRNDALWREADRRLTFPELQGLCIGYSRHGTAGAGMGPKLRKQVLQTAKEIIEAGIDDPAIFELMGLLEEGIGADRISDMVGRIIVPDLYAFSSQIFKKLDAPTEQVEYQDKKYDLVRNPYNGQPVTLVPRDVLMDLPVANSWDEIDTVVSFNRKLREEFNRLVRQAWRQRTRPPKSVIRDVLMQNPKVLRQFVDTYQEAKPDAYDFEIDPSGYVAPIYASSQLIQDFPNQLVLPNQPTVDDVLNVVIKIAEHFRDLVENNSQNSLLYNDAPHGTRGRIVRQPKHEEASQNVFFVIADAYCKANNLDLSPEVDSGRGPVDFKVSHGYKGRVLVEVKLTTNSQLIHGFEKQLVEYQKAEKTQHSIYLVIDVEGGSRVRLQRLRELAKSQTSSGGRIPLVIEVDARFKASASKY